MRSLYLQIKAPFVRERRTGDPCQDHPRKKLRETFMESIKPDPEDQREMLRAAKILHKAITDNDLEIPYVMEALQGLYAWIAKGMVSYEKYSKNVDMHKKYYKKLWEQKT